MSRKVVVTGLGALTPIGNTTDEFWNGLKDGKSGACPITYFNTEKFKTRFACQLESFDASHKLSYREIRTNDPYVQYALVSVEEAMVDSGIDVDKIDLERAGVIWGTGNGGIKTFHEGVTEYNEGDGTPRYNPYFIPKILVNMGAGIIAIKYGFKGLTFAPISACATSNTAIIEAFYHIKWDKADMIVCGGSDAPITESSIAGFNASQALSKNNDNWEMASKPFDSQRDGFVMGEGAGALILEELEHALKRGTKIYGEIVGGAMTSDAYHLTATHPEGEGAQRGIKLALSEANLKPDDVDYVNAHATSTPLGDISELVALNAVFNTKSPKISATKSMTGHLLGAAGAIEAIVCLKAIQHQMIPPTINVKNPDPAIPEKLDIVFGSAIPAEVNVAMSNNFGFGGHNSILIMKEFNP